MPTYNILFDEQALRELRSQRRTDQATIVAAIERHLSHEPTRVSRVAIKKLEPPVLATYRLRVGKYRVFYDVDEDAMSVRIVAVREKGRRTLNEAADGNGH